MWYYEDDYLYKITIIEVIKMALMVHNPFGQDAADFNEWKSNTPQKKFYYPSQVTPANVSANLSGTLFSWPLKNNTTTNTKAPTFIGEFYLPEELKTEKQKQKELEQKQKELLAASGETASETATNNDKNNQEDELI